MDGRRKKIIISLARKEGKKLAEECPNIANDYRNGMTKRELVDKYLCKKTPLAMSIVGYALKELLDPKEKEELKKRHQSESGKRMYELKKGSHDIAGRKNTYIGTFKKLGFVTRYGQVYETKMDERSFVINLRLSGYKWKQIKDFVNEKFGNNRNLESIRALYSIWKGKIFEEVKIKNKPIAC